jgi:hypothetical protein
MEVLEFVIITGAGAAFAAGLVILFCVACWLLFYVAQIVIFLVGALAVGLFIGAIEIADAAAKLSKLLAKWGKRKWIIARSSSSK